MARSTPAQKPRGVARFTLRAGFSLEGWGLIVDDIGVFDGVWNRDIVSFPRRSLGKRARKRFFARPAYAAVTARASRRLSDINAPSLPTNLSHLHGFRRDL